MKYVVNMSDYMNDEEITLNVVASSVFDAIDIAATMIEHPEETELVDAYPVLD